MYTLYRVVRAASTMKEYNTAVVRDYAILLHGVQYTARQLESLPLPLRPSSLAVKKSDQALVFFTKFSVLSNHHPSTFVLEDNTFHSMEQYLAFKKAELANNTSLMEKAMHVQDPAEAKSILNALRNECSQDWQGHMSSIAAIGLRAKFGQNKDLADYLKNTEGLHLGEASNNQSWGIGMTLEDKHVLDTNKWNTSGNLLGNLLMQLRSDLPSDDTPQL